MCVRCGVVGSPGRGGVPAEVGTGHGTPVPLSYTRLHLVLTGCMYCPSVPQKYIEWSPANAGAWGRCVLDERAGVCWASWQVLCRWSLWVVAALPCSPTNPLPHIPLLPTRFADLERSLGEAERARAVYELAITQPVLDMPEILWKVGCRRLGLVVVVWGGGLRAGRAGAATHLPPPSRSRCAPASPPKPPPCLQAYIDFEIGEGNREGARELYERLLQRTRHVKVRQGWGCRICCGQVPGCRISACTISHSAALDTPGPCAESVKGPPLLASGTTCTFPNNRRPALPVARSGCRMPSLRRHRWRCWPHQRRRTRVQRTRRRGGSSWQTQRQQRAARRAQVGVKGNVGAWGLDPHRPPLCTVVPTASGSKATRALSVAHTQASPPPAAPLSVHPLQRSVRRGRGGCTNGRSAACATASQTLRMRQSCCWRHGGSLSRAAPRGGCLVGSL